MIRKAVIPLAGLGTRLRPLTFAVPKAMLPLVDAADRVRPVVDYIVTEAVLAGIRQVALIVSPGQTELIQKYLASVASTGERAVPDRIEYILQPTPQGFGDAVAQGEEFVGGEPFLLLLGDHVYLADRGAPPCAAQVVRAFAECGGAAMVGMQPVRAEELPKVGTAGGEPIGKRVYRCRDFIEKPSPAEARKRLLTRGLPRGRFLAHCGIYCFSAEIFDCLAELVRTGRRTKDEIQLADAQSLLLSRHKEDYYLYRIAGRAYDTGTPEGYTKAFTAFLRSRERVS